MKLKLHRDKVISVVRGKDLVGVYAKITPKDRALYYENKILGEKYGYEFKIENELAVMLAEMSPEKADKIIELWNKN
jgi:flagellar motility protein MotE (MotC chaperone)